jgi:hypothetical protein
VDKCFPSLGRKCYQPPSQPLRGRIDHGVAFATRINPGGQPVRSLGTLGVVAVLFFGCLALLLTAPTGGDF